MTEIADLRSKILDLESNEFAPAFSDEELQQMIDLHGNNIHYTAGHILFVLAENDDKLHRWMRRVGDIEQARNDLREIGKKYIERSQMVNGEPI